MKRKPLHAGINDGYHVLIGRFQPLHNGHRELIDRLLVDHKKVLVMVMNTPLDKDNPFTLQERFTMFRRVYEEEPNLTIMGIPPILSINLGRKCGYTIRKLDSRGKEGISAGRIRKSIREGSGWAFDVPLGVAELIYDKISEGEI